MPLAASRCMDEPADRSITSTASARPRPYSLASAASASRVEIEHRQHAHTAVGAGARLDQQRALAVAGRSSSATISSAGRCAASAGARIMACMRSIMAARPDGILSAARSPWPSSTPSASACLCAEQVQHLVLDRILADEIDDGHRAGLVLAPGARDALLELRRIPRQIDIHDRARRLEVEPDAAAVGREEQPAGRDPA